MNPYRERIWAQLSSLLKSVELRGRVLDFGCGDGWFASQVRTANLAGVLVPVDVKRRDNVLVEPTIYAPGEPLPFQDREFDLTYAIDVLHHCDDPFAQLDDLDRVTSRHLIIKDHTYRTAAGRWTLAILDELGNRRFGIPSPYHYQFGWTWSNHLREKGWALRGMIHPMGCHVGVMGKLTNPLQYLAHYERV